MSKHTYRLVYAGPRGRGEFIRLIFKYFDVEFEDYHMGDKWKDRKEDAPMHQLPYLEIDDGKFKLCQSMAICRYLSKALKPDAWFAGATKPEAALCDMYVDAAMDLFQLGVFYKYSQDPVKDYFKTMFETGGKQKLKILEDHLISAGGKYFVGKKVTWADLIMITVFSILEEIGAAPMIQEHKVLVRYYLHIRALPEIKEYIKENWPETELEAK